MKAVIYARYSSDAQKETSIEDQVRDCTDFAKRQGIAIIHVYADKMISGKTDHRPEFQRMLSDSEKKDFDYVIVWKLDRFARNRTESAINKYHLGKSGVKVLSAMENISDGPEGIILESVIEGYAEYYLYDLKQKTSRGLRGIALQCKHTGGRPLLGYEVNADKTYAVEPYAAETIKLIFNMYAEGQSYSKIIDRLNSEGRRTATGGKFGKNSLHELLRNERYTGTYIFNKIKSRDMDGKRNSHAVRSADDIVRIEDGMPAIIDKDLFERVQKKMDERKVAPAVGKAKVEYLLTSKIFCGKCGHPMVGNQVSGRYHYYECSEHKRKRTCDKRPVQKDWIENTVIAETMRLLHNDELLDQIATAAAQLAEKENDSNDMVKALRRRIKDVDTSIANMLKAIEMGVITESTKDRLLELEESKAQLSGQLSEYVLISKNVVTKDDILFFLCQFREGDATDAAFQKRLIEVFINSVFVFDDKVVITFNYSGNGSKITILDLEGAVPPAPSYPRIG